MARRTKMTLAILTVLLASTIAVLALASRSSVSPAEAAANAAPPPPGPTSAYVEERPLAETVSLRGAITAPTAVDIVAPSASSEGIRPILTGLKVKVGDSLTTPLAVAEVGGRPIILLHSDQAFYRDIKFGDTGPDVSRLQASLGVKETGTFNGDTQAALAELYESLGYAPPVNTPTEPVAEGDTLQPLLDGLEDARTAGALSIRTADLALEEARAALAGGTGSAAAVEQARLALDAAIDGRNTAVSRAERDVRNERERLRLEALLRGPFLRVVEILAVPRASLTVISVPVTVGTELAQGARIATLGDPVLEAVVFVTSAEAQLLKPGMPASLTGAGLAAEIAATVLDISAAPEGAGQESGTADESLPVGSTATAERPYRVRLTMAEQPAASSIGMGILATVTIEGTDAAVVAVPVVALQQIGGEEVVVTLPDRRRWKVDTGLVAEGWVELRDGAPPVGSKVETR